MNIVCIGGLGNQIFQYAFYRACIERGLPARLDISLFKNYKLHNGFELEKIFNLVPKIGEIKPFARFIYKVLRKLRAYNYEIEQSYFCEYNEKYFTNKPNIVGYWQSEKYFKGISAIIRNELTFPQLDKVNQCIANEIVSCNAVSIHIRRGDYLENERLGIEYYNQAIEYINKHIDQPVFYIFSNDIEWCRQNLINDFSIKFVEGNNGTQSYKDMYLMSLCKHNIIANSSFSWWGGWLNNNVNKLVIAPKNWFNSGHNLADLFPAEWILI